LSDTVGSLMVHRGLTEPDSKRLGTDDVLRVLVLVSADYIVPHVRLELCVLVKIFNYNPVLFVVFLLFDFFAELPEDLAEKCLGDGGANLEEDSAGGCPTVSLIVRVECPYTQSYEVDRSGHDIQTKADCVPDQHVCIQVVFGFLFDEEAFDAHNTSNKNEA
jgi:hypothetical protein